MIARRKRRLATALLIVFRTWPLVHYQLVRVYRLDPWKFGGWAMYTVVNFLPRVEVFAMRGGERQHLGLGSHDLPASRAASEPPASSWSSMPSSTASSRTPSR